MPPPSQTAWRHIADWAKRNPSALRLAAALGRGQGRLRPLDRLEPAPPAPRLKPDLRGWADHALAAVWIGHATLLLRVGGRTILTDPVFSNRIGLSLGLMTGGPRRFLAPALSIKQLPKLDLILVSHAHFDHLDRPSLRRLPRDVPVITSHGVRDLLSDLGFKRVTELRWGDSVAVSGMNITSREVRHWGARTFLDTGRGYGAFLIESPRHRVLFGADSAYHELFRDLRDIDLAILGIGAYDPYVAAHATPEQALAMANHMGAKRILPMHHSTFRLSHEPMGEPIERLLKACDADPSRVVVTEVGGAFVEA